jgi:spermidine synthase
VAASTEVESIEAVEIIPAVVEGARHFEMVNHGVTEDRRVDLILNDGRNHLILSDRRYDVITSDPVHPLYGSAALYSLDYFRLCRSRLAAGGMACQYLPLHRMPTREFRRAIATFQEAFPETWVLFGLGHAMLLGSTTPIELDWQRWQRRLKAHALRADLEDSVLAWPGQFAALLQLDPEACRLIGEGPPSTDLHPHLEFLAPAAYRPGLWEANARLLVEGYRSPFGRIEGLPPGAEAELRRLVAGKRLLLFSLLRRNDGDLRSAVAFLGRALEIAGDDPEIVRYANQLRAEVQRAGRS